MKKKLLSIFLGASLLLSSAALVACGDGGGETTDADITDLPDAGVAVTVVEYPNLSYDGTAAASKVTDDSIAEGTFTVSYSASEKLSLYLAKDSIVTAANGTTYLADGLRYNSYDLTATAAGDYSLYLVTEDNELAAAYDWRVAPAYPERARFPAITGLHQQNTAATGIGNAHDPSIIEVDGVYYSFGTDNYGPRFGYSIRSSTDLINWTYVGAAIDGYNVNGNPPTRSTMAESNELWEIYEILSAHDLYDNVYTLWAPNVVPAAGGGYWLYGCWTAVFGSGVSIIFQCHSDTVTGPYTLSRTANDEPAVIVYSYDGWGYGANSNPNALDPFVYYDASGEHMYMAYGSFGSAAGIWCLELDPETGLRKDGLEGADLLPGSTKTAAERYGKNLVVNDTEGPTVSYHEGVEVSSYNGTGSYDASASRYEDRYYLMTSSNSLTYNYNMRSYYSTSADGPFRYGTSDQEGSRVSGTFSWRTGPDGDVGRLGFDDWFAPGHNDMFTTDEGENMLVFHVRNGYRTAAESNDENTQNNFHFQVQTLYAFNSRGDLVMNPNRYAGERLRKVTAAEITSLTEGAYSFVCITNSNWEASYNQSYAMEGLTLSAPESGQSKGAINYGGNVVGEWELYGDNYVYINITSPIAAVNGSGSLSGKFYGVAFPARIEKTLYGGISISCVSESGKDCLYLNMDFEANA